MLALSSGVGLTTALGLSTEELHPPVIRASGEVPAISYSSTEKKTMMPFSHEVIFLVLQNFRAV